MEKAVQLPTYYLWPSTKKINETPATYEIYDPLMRFVSLITCLTNLTNH